MYLFWITHIKHVILIEFIEAMKLYIVRYIRVPNVMIWTLENRDFHV